MEWEEVRSRIKEVVDASDPMSLLCHGAPDDEYDPEIDGIVAVYIKTGPQLEELTQGIQAVFDRWFSPGAVHPARSRFIATQLCECLPPAEQQEEL